MIKIISYNVQQSLIYKEFLKNQDKEYDRNKMFFDRVREKYIHNIDTLYYTAFILDDFKNGEGKSCGYSDSLEVINLLLYLNNKREEALDTFESVLLNDFGSSGNSIQLPHDLFVSPLSFGMYQYCIEKKDKYMIFIARSMMNENTPQIIVQLRSEFLWLSGERAAVNESYQDLEKLLQYFNLSIANCSENRIDYSYHTNYIQDQLNFFKEDNLNSMQVSRFTRWDKQGRFVGSDDIECDYLSLGRRKSNNTFVRIYNKTQEVLNQGYKQFFIKIWLLNNMINRFDYYILEKCFENNGYSYVDKARLEFYIEFGSSLANINYCKELLKGYDLEKIKQLADKLTPRLTIVTNIEIQTKRKFYSTMSGSIDMLQTVTNKYKPLVRVFKILDNKDLFHTFITTNVIRFVDRSSNTYKSDCKTSLWWERIQKVDLNRVIDKTDRKLVRTYQRDLDIDKLKTTILNKLATFSLYQKDINVDPLNNDILDFMSFLNESDVEKTLDYKSKKTATLKSQLEHLVKPSLVSRYSLIDNNTAELFD